MRISTLQMYSKSINEMLDKQASVSNLQVHIANGKKIFTPSDDPIGASKAILLKEELSRSETYQKNCVYAKNHLEQQESILKSSTNIVQRISELVVQAGSSALSDVDRHAIVEEINVRKKELLDLSNTRNLNGDYFFSGFKSKVEAVKVDNKGDYIYQGDDGQRQLSLGGTTQISSNLSGKAMFFNIQNSELSAKIIAGKSVVSSANSGLVDSLTLPSLSNIDLKINNTTIPAAIPDGVSTTDSSASAISFVQAINSLQSEHKTWASVLPNQINLGIFTPGVILPSQFSINQVPIIDMLGSEGSLIDAINIQSDLTGVSASQPGGAGSAIMLTASDGRNVQIKTNGASVANFSNFDISGGLNLDKVQRAAISLRSDSTIQLGGASPVNLGLAAGNYMVSTNLGSGVLKAEVISEVNNLNKTYSIVFGVGVFNIYDDENPLQPILGFQDRVYNPGEKIKFQDFELELSGNLQTGDVFNLGSEKPAFQDIFKTIDNIIYAVKNFGNDSPRLSYEIGIGLSNLESAQINFSRVHSIIGASLNVTESQLDIQADFQLMTREVLSQIEDLDYAKAISDLTQATFILEAAQKSFIHIQSLSIFNYLR